jgi:stage V sporulation protein S
MYDIVKVSSTSHPAAVAGAIAGIMRESGNVEVRAIGAGAINQAMKALTIARKYLVQDDLDLSVVPNFETLDINGEERTALRLSVFKRPASILLGV